MNNMYLKLRLLLLKLILWSKQFKAEESISIFSEARGGSTWLMELLNQSLDVCINWEPLHLEKGIIPDKYNFGFRPFLPIDYNDEELKRVFKKIYTLKVSNEWTNRFTGIKKLINAERVLVKYVRANMLLPYILNNFYFKYPPIFLIRNPIDTCLSQIKAFGEIKDINAYFEHAYSERYLKHSDFLQSLRSSLELQIAIWCINNSEVIKKISDYNVYVIYYSDLLLDPKKELEILFRNYGFQERIDRLNKLSYRKVSSSSARKNLLDPKEQLLKNINELDYKTKESIQRVYDYFDFKLYSAFSPNPYKQILTNKHEYE